MRSTALLLLLASGIALPCIALPAHAETPATARTRPRSAAKAPAEADEEKARAAFFEGKEHATEGRYVEACKSFEESLSLIEGVGTMYHLAGCYEKLGKSASAQRLFLRAAAVADRASQRERADAARERAVALEPKLARLLVQIDSIDANVQIRTGGEPWEPGTAIAVDPGPQRISATAPGKRAWSTTVEVPSEPVLLTLIVPALEASAPTHPEKRKPKARTASEPSRPLSHSALTTASDAGSPTQRHIALAVGGVGIASLVTGGVFAALYKVTNDEAKAVCPSGIRCSAEEIEDHGELVDDARTARLWSYVGFGAGAALLGGATILYLSSGGRSQEESSVRASAAIGPDGTWAAFVRGRF